jgi:hypothetical protein
VTGYFTQVPIRMMKPIRTRGLKFHAIWRLRGLYSS